MYKVFALQVTIDQNSLYGKQFLCLKSLLLQFSEMGARKEKCLCENYANVQRQKDEFAYKIFPLQVKIDKIVYMEFSFSV